MICFQGYVNNADAMSPTPIYERLTGGTWEEAEILDVFVRLPEYLQSVHCTQQHFHQVCMVPITKRSYQYPSQEFAWLSFNVIMEKQSQIFSSGNYYIQLLVKVVETV